MTFVDWMTVTGAFASFAGLLGSNLKQFQAYRKWFLGFGLFFLGLVTAKLLDVVVPSQSHGLKLSSRELAWGVILFVGALLVLIAAIRENTGSAIFVTAAFALLISTNAGPLLRENGFSPNEQLAIVDLREKTGNYDGAIALMQELEKTVSDAEKQAMEKRIMKLQSEKVDQINGPK